VLDLRKLPDHHPTVFTLSEDATISQEANKVRHEERVPFCLAMDSIG
jgi:hypothetical protein